MTPRMVVDWDHSGLRGQRRVKRWPSVNRGQQRRVDVPLTMSATGHGKTSGIEEYERSWEQNEELGLNDMDTSAADAAYECN
ncbi:hypothetical protein E5676_scaffold129G00040 [Cucumis melo var. makuwa]|uniref:Uncharacterized protein n=1 Tax=Cucumis melo var. makuwa TaxID=1194695 RepID=A0A5A7TMG0_CUCMM|nr:hypothetical protein E6C27_scaffold110G001190 [Cucumis melo var. makuwa]TYK29300.1 hypothetical protein E5676_scaffold129G00040 [Cucumis melo var. makuwa]